MANRYKNYYDKLSLPELAAKYILFLNDITLSHDAAIEAILQSMRLRCSPEEQIHYINQARDVYNMLVPEIEEGVPF